MSTKCNKWVTDETLKTLLTFDEIPLGKKVLMKDLNIKIVDLGYLVKS